MLKGLAGMFVSGLVIPFFVVRRSSFVRVRGKVVEFSSSLMGIFHGASVAASTAKCKTRNITASHT